MDHISTSIERYNKGITLRISYYGKSNIFIK
ncbi:hypothetical protein [Clostridium sp. KNHs214]|nr:hypothetical protein [Clostridium sp. KNHs214]